MRTSPLFVVAAILVDDRNRVLIQKRPEGKPYAGYWEFPGGKVDAGETPGQAVIRELHEELNLDVREEDIEPLTFFAGEYEDKLIINLAYICRVWSGVPSSSEGQELAWVNIGALPDYDLLDKNRGFLPILARTI